LTGILAAVDHSQFAYAVVMRAVQLASLQKSDLTLISVVKPGLGVRNTMVGEEEQLASFHRELIYKCFLTGGVSVASSGYGGTGAVYKSTSTGIMIRTLIDHGDPVERICAQAEALKADLVVVGNRGLGEAGTFILGSVSQKVVQKCSRPVLVVKEPGSDPSDWQRLNEVHRARRGISSK
jgi:nucleotide-binding universal stress UspA family protein